MQECSAREAHSENIVQAELIDEDVLAHIGTRKRIMQRASLRLRAAGCAGGRFRSACCGRWWRQ
jgi:hypothetical protein